MGPSVFIGGDAGKVVNDTIAAIGAAAGVVQTADTLAAIEQGATATGCLAGGPVDLACDVLVAYDIYAIANALFSELWSEFSGPQFKGSLLPRPRALGGLGSSATGIPNENLSLQEIHGQPFNKPVPSSGVNLP